MNSKHIVSNASGIRSPVFLPNESARANAQFTICDADGTPDTGYSLFECLCKCNFGHRKLQTIKKIKRIVNDQILRYKTPIIRSTSVNVIEYAEK